MKFSKPKFGVGQALWATDDKGEPIQFTVHVITRDHFGWICVGHQISRPESDCFAQWDDLLRFHYNEKPVVKVPARKRFKAPSLRTWKMYCDEIGFMPDEAENAWNHYESVGWVVGKAKKPVKDWQACARTCLRRQVDHGAKSRPGGGYV